MAKIYRKRPGYMLIAEPYWATTNRRNKQHLFTHYRDSAGKKVVITGCGGLAWFEDQLVKDPTIHVSNQCENCKVSVSNR